MSEIKPDQIKKVRVLGINYEIQYVDTMKQNGCEDTGNIDNTGCRMTINNYHNSKVHIQSVLWHEILEALDYRLELKLTHQQKTQLEAGTLQVMRDNTELIMRILNTT